jgi:predicted amidophosphoribosyltransferase
MEALEANGSIPCKFCGGELKSEVDFCNTCGRDADGFQNGIPKEDETPCLACGAIINKYHYFCHQCAAPVRGRENRVPHEKKPR